MKITKLREMTEQQTIQIIEKHSQLKNVMQTLRFFGLPDHGGNHATLKRILKRNGIHYERDGTNRKHVFNERYFEKIDTEEKAYWLGFIAADGSINDAYCLNVTLAEVDIDHLHKLKAAIGTDMKLGEQFRTMPSGYFSRCFFVRFYSKKMAADLAQLGIVPRKSLTLRPSPVSEDLLIAYLRGYFDGDGGLYLGKRGATIKPSASITATRELCDLFTTFLLKYGINTTLSKRMKNETNNYMVVVNGSYQTKKFLDILYNGSTIYLERKHALYLTLVQILAEDAAKKEHYVYTNHGKWLYRFYMSKKAFRGKVFSTKQEAFQACLGHMKALNYQRGMEKLVYFNSDCEV